MHVAVLGAGVMGLATAWYLAKAGCAVTVVDRQSGPALETSFGNAGGLCPSLSGPWAAPGMPLKALKWMADPHAPFGVKPKMDPDQWRWLAQFLRNCTPHRYAANKAAIQRIAHHSLACLSQVRAEAGIVYDGGAGGILQLFQTSEEVEGGKRAAGVLEKLGIPHRRVDEAGARALEPGLKAATAPIAGGLHFPIDETGDCHLFSVGLAAALAARGVVFRFGETVERLIVEGGACRGAETGAGRIAADAVVVALATGAPALVRPLGLKLPVYPVKGYSLTAPIRHPDAAPRSSIMDEHTKVMVTRFANAATGDRLRVAGIAEVAGYGRDIEPHRCEAIRLAAQRLFPDAADYGAATYWAGLRPMTPDGPPYLGKTPVGGLFLNVGHGSNGWTQACGSGDVLADLVTGRQPAIDLAGLSYAARQ